MRSRSLAVVLTLGTILCVAPLQADTAHKIIDRLADRMYAIGETSGKPDDFQRAVEAAAADIAGQVARGDDLTYAELDAKGRTPLIVAARSGYAPVVAALLDSPTAVRTINMLDQDGLSAWDHSSLALRRSIWACVRVFDQDPFAWLPMLVTTSWYAENEPYRQTQRLLAAVGAEQAIERARAYWLDSCVGQSEATRTSVGTTDDLLKTVVEAGNETLEGMLRKLD